MIPTTIFYPYCDLAGWEWNELRYSIRSFCKFLPINRVIVVGYKPPWYTGEFIPYPDGNRKERNIFEKLCEAAKVCDRFIFANDDHFMLKPDPIDYYYSRTLKEKVSEDWYGKQCKNTCDIFPEGLFFDVHFPMIVEADKIPMQYDWSKEYVLKSLYCNHNGIAGVKRQDCKVPGFMPYSSITNFCADRSFMSLGPQALSKDMKKWLMNEFPNPSSFEFGEVKELV